MKQRQSPECGDEMGLLIQWQSAAAILERDDDTTPNVFTRVSASPGRPISLVTV